MNTLLDHLLNYLAQLSLAVIPVCVVEWLNHSSQVIGKTCDSINPQIKPLGNYGRLPRGFCVGED